MRKGEFDAKKFKPAIMYTIYIASTPEKVWQALTSAEFSKKYFFGNSVEVDLKVGGAISCARLMAHCISRGR
jgi:uncharacterized protein YndB with AHSA1/START domain